MGRLFRSFVFVLFLGLLSQIIGCSGGSNSGSSTIVIGSPGSVSAPSKAAQNQTISVSATFSDSHNKPAAFVPVVFTSTLGTFSPADGRTTTDATGTATIQLNVGSISGDGVITATATINGAEVVKQATFNVAPPQLGLSAITLGLSPISYGGSTSVSVQVLDANGVPYTAQEVDVNFTSVQAAAGNASIPPSVKTVNGVATVTYKALTNTGDDTITVSISGASKSATITIKALDAQAISFVSASPTNIGLKGMGGIGISETSKVVFKVLDTSGSPKANQAVDFSLNTTIGGITLTSVSASSDGNGLVSTNIQSGNFATPVRVTATLHGTSISTQSDQLVISTGIPSQDGFSLAIQTLNVEAYHIVGVADKVTVRMSDHFHNPVPDGTAVYFTTNGGSIEPVCYTSQGACSVTWTSQTPYPAGFYNPISGNTTNKGRATILAYAIGEEAFKDLNGNGVADPGEFTDDSGAYLDENENGQYDAGQETPIPFSGTGFDPPDGKYNGILQGPAYIGAPRTKHVFANGTMVMCTSSALITKSGGVGINVPVGDVAAFTITVSDLNGNVMPLGTKVDFAVTAFSGVGSFANFSLVANSYTFANSNAAQGVTLPVRVASSGDAGTHPTNGVLTVTVTSPGGVVTTKLFDITSP